MKKIACFCGKNEKKKPDVKIRFLFIQFSDQTSYTLPYYSARTVEVYFHSEEWK